MSRTLLFALVLLLCACGGSPYPGYKEASDGIHLRYITLGEGEQLVGDSDSVRVRFRMARLGEEPGSYWSSEQWFLGSDLRSDAMVPVLRRLHAGDSMSVIATASRWPWTALSPGNEGAKDTAMISVEISLIELRTPQQMRADADRLRATDPTAYERRLIEAYIKRSKRSWVRWGTSDMHYHIEGAAVDTNAVRYREVVQLSWEGRRLEDGQVFDAQGSQGAAFTWSFGTPDQLVQGLETAVSLLREGQEGSFILPSSMAFGARGIPGTLEPHTPVIYTVRLVGVERGG